MPKTPRRPLFVPTGAVPPDEGWRIAHRASDTYDRSMRMAMTEVVHDFQSTNLVGFEKALSKGTQSAVAQIDWVGYRDNLEESIASRFEEISKMVIRESGIDIDPRDIRVTIRSQAREAANVIAANSRAGATRAVSRLRRKDLTPRQISNRLRPLLGLNRVQANAALNRAFQMEELGASPSTIIDDLKLRGARATQARAASIARFENLRAATLTQRESVLRAQDIGLLGEGFKRCVAALDVDHEFCMRINGQVQPVDEPFIDTATGASVGDPPFHNGCRCGVSYDAVEL